MSDVPADDEVRLTFRPLRDEAPAAIRIRRLLKHALRSLRLRCTCVEPAPDAPKANDDGGRGRREIRAITRQTGAENEMEGLAAPPAEGGP